MTSVKNGRLLRGFAHFGLVALALSAHLLSSDATPRSIAAGPSKSSPRLRLAHGHHGKFYWAVGVEAEAPGRPHRPCMINSAGSRSVTVCGSLQPIPLLLGNASSEGRVKGSVLAMAFPRHVGLVRLWFDRGRPRQVRLRLLSRHQSSIVGLQRFSYAALSFGRPFCIKRFATYSRSTSKTLQLSRPLDCDL